MSSFFNMFRSSSQKSSSRRNSSLQSKALKFETLENREMLAITSILSEVYEDSVSKADEPAEFYLDLTSDDTKVWVTVGLIVETADGSSLDPSKIAIKYYNDDTEEYDKDIPAASTILHQTDGTNKSTIIVTLPGDTYMVQLGGDNGTTGAFTVDVYVPGGTEENPTSVAQYTPLLVQAGIHQVDKVWNPAMEGIYKHMLGGNYSKNIAEAYSELNVTGTGQLNYDDASILGTVAASGKVTAELSKTEPEKDDLTFSAATESVQEKSTAFGTGTAAITVTGGSKTSLADYTVSLKSTYTISGGSGADLSKVELPTLTSGTDYKFEGGKFYFNPNGKFDFIPKGTTATLTLTFTATDKTTTTLTGDGTITITIVGANDSPALDKTDVDLTSAEIWSQPWSETVDGVNKNHGDEVQLVIDGNQIKHGSTVIATIKDDDVSDTFTFASIGFPEGSVTFEDSTWILWSSSGSDKKALGEITLSEDKRTLTYRAAGDRDDSFFTDLGNDELSDKFKFTFTVQDNRGVTTAVSGGDQKSESGTCSVELQVKGMQDPVQGLKVTSTGTKSVSLRAQEYETGLDSPSVPLPSFFTVENIDEKILKFSFSDKEISDDGSVTNEMSEAIANSIMDAFEINGSDETDGLIRFNRSVLSAEANTFLNSLPEGEYIDFTFKVKVQNTDVESEYMLSETLTVRFVRTIALVVEDADLSVSRHDKEWVSPTQTSTIKGGAGQTSTKFYDIETVGDYTVSYTVNDGMVHEKPNLVKGEDYKIEIVVVNENTGELGVKFYFNPNGKFDFLADGQDAVVTFTLRLDDTINQMISSTFEWEVTVRGEAASTVPEFKEDYEPSIDENKVLTINVTDLITNTNSDTANWVVEQVYVKAEDVKLVNGQAPDPSTQVDGYYAISRQTSTEQTITYNSGSVVKLVTSGVLTFDPTGRTDDLGPYDKDDPDTYAEESLKIRVYDTVSQVPPTSQWMNDYTILVKGVQEDAAPEFKDATLETYQNNVYTITGSDIATSNNSDAELVIDQISVDFDLVKTVDGKTPAASDKKDGMYIIDRPSKDEITVILTNGTTFSLDSDGVLTYNPTTREGKLESPYEEGRGTTYSDTKLTFIVADISGDTAVKTTTAEEYNIRTKGVSYPTFREGVNLNTPDQTELTVKASELATSDKTDATLVIDKVAFDFDDIQSVNGETPKESDVDDDSDLYLILRSETDQVVILKSGTIYTLTKEGELKVDPRERDPLPPYDSDDDGTYQDEEISVVVADTSIETPAVSSVKQFTIRIKGVVEEETPVPEFRGAVDLNTNETEILTINGSTLATSTNADAQLVIESVSVDADLVELVNGEPLDEESIAEEIGFIERSTTDQTITLKSGTVLTLTPEGVLKFDPTEREKLPMYDADDPTTYAVEEFSVVVADDSSSPPTETVNSKEFSVRVKGTTPSADTPTFKEAVELSMTDGGIFQMDASTIAESSKVDAALVVDRIAVKVEDVKLVNGNEPNSNTAVDGYYIITRSTVSPQSIELNNGTTITLAQNGDVQFDASDRGETLPPYDESNDETYIDAKVRFSVRDTSGTSGTDLVTALQEFTIRIKGREGNTGGDEEINASLQNYSVATDSAAFFANDDAVTSQTTLDFSATENTSQTQAMETDDSELQALYDHVSTVLASKADALDEQIGLLLADL